MQTPYMRIEHILEKLQISALTTMQQEALSMMVAHPQVLLLSATGSGKTLAYLLSIMNYMEVDLPKVNALIIVPSRELAIQVLAVARSMATGLKIDAVYGGRPIAKDKIDLRHPPHILIGTPGRIGDHLRRQTIDMTSVTTLVIDEYDKTLDIDFEDQMAQIRYHLPSNISIILTSATRHTTLPTFLPLSDLVVVDHLLETPSLLSLKKITAPTNHKLDTLVRVLKQLNGLTGIVFCNFKESIRSISDALNRNQVRHGIYHGSLEQIERERALIKLRNGTLQLLLATDLAARGIDIPALGFIIHYHLPIDEEAFTHRNGRTARMHHDGSAYVLLGIDEPYPDYMGSLEEAIISPQDSGDRVSLWSTISISAGKRDNISKRDIMGFVCKQGGLEAHQVGLIEIQNSCAYVSIPSSDTIGVVRTLNNTRIKKSKVRVARV